GIAVGDAVLMLSNSVYSVISPEGCASILWRDGDKASQAADALKLTAQSLLDLGVIDEIVPEPPGGAHSDPDKPIAAVGEAIVRHLSILKKLSVRRLVEKRYDKYTAIGRFGKR
ncbi:MAG: acetyl-CoA carboxylase carboxyl transferase subunit alpha, partial [Lentisphaerae bacterium]|nr:acetyl-CoA carboxylase carboxyl transferase subunit alpha [Lentisphaerota bacterium]